MSLHHHHDHAGHTHGGHDHADPRRPLVRALVLTVIVAIAEVIGGVLTNSLALIADAGHMITDVGALGLALLAGWLVRRTPPPGQTFGGRRWEVLAALVNGTALIAISGAILWEGVTRLSAPPAVEGGLMLVVAVIGLITNALSAYWLHGVSETSLNARGAYLHVLADLAGSLATIVAAICVVTGGWTLADPIASMAVAVLVFFSAWRLMRDATSVLLEATPRHIDIAGVRDTLEKLNSVESIHDLHVWTVGGGLVAMSAHAVLSADRDGQDVLEASRAAMARLGISHVTIQIERPALNDCESCK